MKTSIARILFAVLMTACLAVFTACGNAENNTQPDFDAARAYAPVLEQYRTAAEEHWDFETLDEKGLCCLPALMDDPAGKIGYCFLPLEPGGRDCLLISFIPDKDASEPKYELLAVYAPDADGKPVLLFNGAERDSFILCGSAKDGYTIAETGSSGAAETVFIFHKVSGNRLTPIETVVYSGSENENEPWFHASGTDETDPAKMRHITEKEARTVIDGYKPCNEDLDLIPLRYYTAP